MVFPELCSGLDTTSIGAMHHMGVETSLGLEDFNAKKRFLNGIAVTKTGWDADDEICCPICGCSVARNDDFHEMRPKHCPDCGTKLVY